MSDEKYMVEVAEAVKSFLQKDDWNYFFEEEKGIFQIPQRVGGYLRYLFYTIYVDDSGLTVYCTLPLGAMPDQLSELRAMEEYAVRINYGLRYGFFMFNRDKGDLRYVMYVHCKYVMPSEDIIRKCLYLPLSMLRRYSPGVIDILFRGASAKDACWRCEHPGEDLPGGAQAQSPASPDAESTVTSPNPVPPAPSPQATQSQSPEEVTDTGNDDDVEMMLARLRRRFRTDES